MIKAKETNLGTYALWKIATFILFVIFCIDIRENFYEKLPTLLIFFQLLAIEALTTARFDGIIE